MGWSQCTAWVLKTTSMSEVGLFGGGQEREVELTTNHHTVESWIWSTGNSEGLMIMSGQVPWESISASSRALIDVGEPGMEPDCQSTLKNRCGTIWWLQIGTWYFLLTAWRLGAADHDWGFIVGEILWGAPQFCHHVFQGGSTARLFRGGHSHYWGHWGR